jgi:threonine aldolase
MLSSILSSAQALGDDVFSEDGPTNDLETYMADLTGLPHAVFVSSGTMGNQIAIRSLLKQPPYSLVCDRRSHIFEYECGMTSMFSQVHLIPVIPQNKQYLTVDEIAANVVPDDGDTHCAPTRVIAVENTRGGKIMPLDELKRISSYAKAHGILLHMDGARLWNACYPPLPEGKSLSLNEAAENAKKLLKEHCALLDTVTLCFSKSLGAPAGSILLSRSPEVISRARHFRKALGGGMRQTGLLSAPARFAVDSVFLSGDLIPRSSAIAKRLQDSWVALGGRIQPGLEQETNMVWLDLMAAKVTDTEFVSIGEEEQVKLLNGRIVTHYRTY